MGMHTDFHFVLECDLNRLREKYEAHLQITVCRDLNKSQLIERKQIVYFIINHFQINKLKRVVHDIDGAAFISLQEVSDIIKISEPQ